MSFTYCCLLQKGPLVHCPNCKTACTVRSLMRKMEEGVTSLDIHSSATLGVYSQRFKLWETGISPEDTVLYQSAQVCVQVWSYFRLSANAQPAGSRPKVAGSLPPTPQTFGSEPVDGTSASPSLSLLLIKEMLIWRESCSFTRTQSIWRSPNFLFGITWLSKD